MLGTPLAAVGLGIERPIAVGELSSPLIRLLGTNHASVEKPRLTW